MVRIRKFCRTTIYCYSQSFHTGEQGCTLQSQKSEFLDGSKAMKSLNKISLDNKKSRMYRLLERRKKTGIVIEQKLNYYTQKIRVNKQE